MIPFDLQRFDSGKLKASERIETLGLDALFKSGLEREAGALVLARLYSRLVARKIMSDLPGLADHDQFRKDGESILNIYITNLTSSLTDDKDIFWVRLITSHQFIYLSMIYHLGTGIPSSDPTSSGNLRIR
jgi:hypothetical protein